MFGTDQITCQKIPVQLYNLFCVKDVNLSFTRSSDNRVLLVNNNAILIFHVKVLTHFIIIQGP